MRANQPEQEAEEAPKKTGKAECYGAWTAKGDKGTINKVRMEPSLDSMVVGKILGGQKMNVIGEEDYKKLDGTVVRRLNINTPKAGWVTAQNFEQEKKKDNDKN